MKYEELAKGDFCEIDEVVKAKVLGLEKSDSGKSILRLISEYIGSIPIKEEDKERDFRNRNASKIIESNYTTGCTDKSILFCTLARCAGYKVLMIETFADNNPINSGYGHVFNKIYDSDSQKWHIYESIFGIRQDYRYAEENYIPAAIGMDFSVYYEGLDDIDQIKESPTVQARTSEDLARLAKMIQGKKGRPAGHAHDADASRIGSEGLEKTT